MTLTQKLFFLALFAQFCFYPIVLVKMFRARVKAIKNKDVSFKYFSHYQLPSDQSLPEHMVVLSNHFNNLFQVPVLFIATGVLAYTLNTIDSTLCFLAWVFVLSRVVHSFIHLGTNNIIYRLRAYGSSIMVLGLIWLLMLGKVFLN